MVFRDFLGGINSASPPMDLRPNQATIMSGLIPDVTTSMVVSKVPALLATMTGGGAFRGTRYLPVTGNPLLVYSGWTLSSPNYTPFVTTFDEVAGTFAGSAIANLTATTSLAEASEIQFAHYRDYLYFTDPNGRLRTWKPGMASAVTCGLPTPDTFPSRTLGGAGLLKAVGTPIPGYQWVYCFYNTDRNILSNPSIACQSLSTPNLNEVSLAPVGGSTSIGTDTNIQEIWWFRRGGYTADYYYCGKSTVTAGNWTAVTFTDNVPDLDQTAQVVNFNNGQPPVGLDVLTTHKNRLFALSSFGKSTAGGSTRLWFSAYARPENWGIDNGLITDGGYIGLDGGIDDAGLALTSMGGYLVIGRRKSVYVLYGTGFDDFVATQRTTVGVAGRRALTRCGNSAYFIGGDKRVYKLTEDDPLWISHQIQKVLDAVSDADLPNCVIASANNTLFLDLPTGLYVYHTYLEKLGIAPFWTVEPAGALDSARHHIFSVPKATTGGEIIYFYYPGTGNYTAWRLYGADGLQTFSWASPWLAYGDDGVRNGRMHTQPDFLRVEGKLLPNGATQPSVSASLVSYGEDWGSTVTQAYSLAAPAAGGELLDTRPHEGLSGPYFTVGLSGTAKSGSVINLVSVSAEPYRVDG